MVKAVIERDDEPEVPASSELEVNAKLMNKAVVSILNCPIWVYPRAAVPIRLFFWGGASPRTASLRAYIIW